MNMKSLVVYCGSRDNVDDVYLNAAEEFGKCMVAENLDLIYGSGKTGLMGRVAKAVQEGGRDVTGITPACFVDRFNDGDHKTSYGKTVVVETMHERKNMMAEMADGFVALPGGYGTMEELFEIITWYHIGLHQKPIGVLNTNNYYDKMLEWIQHSTDEGFIYKEALDAIVTDSDPKALLDKLIAKSKAQTADK